MINITNITNIFNLATHSFLYLFIMLFIIVVIFTLFIMCDCSIKTYSKNISQFILFVILNMYFVPKFILTHSPKETFIAIIDIITAMYKKLIS